MTIPQADSTDLCSVSDRQEVVTLAEVGVVDPADAEVPKTTTSLVAEQGQQNQYHCQQQQQQQEGRNTTSSPSETQQATNGLTISINSSCIEGSILIENKQKKGNEESGREEAKEAVNEERKALKDVNGEYSIETVNIGNTENQNALKNSYLVLSLRENHDKSCEDKLNVIDQGCNIASSQFVNNPQKSQRDEESVSALPLLKIPSFSSIPSTSVSYNHRTRKSSINFPLSNHESSTAIAVSSSSSSYSSSSSLSNSRKVRRKSLPQRLGLRYQKIPQDDIVSPSEADTNKTNDVNSGILNPQYLPSPDSVPFSSSSQDRPSHQLSFHNAEVHASFHPSQTSTITTSALNQEHQQHPITSINIPTTSQVINQSQTFSQGVTFASPKFPATGRNFNPSSSKKDQKNTTSVVNTSCASTSSSSKNRNKSGRGGSSNKTSLPLRRTLSLSLKSLNDLSVVHPAGRGNSNRKKHKAHSRSVSTEDLANCRVHRAGGGRFAGDPHPSPGSPSHCCLVSVSRVPMAAATSHLTLDSEYQTVRLAVLGAPGVGKSSIVKQFVMQQFLEEYVPTEQRQIFCPAVIINDHLYEVRIIDCPYIPYFPVNSLYEWTDFRGYGLRNATAYVLVYDITSEESFEYIKSLRLQILESRNLHDVPIFVVGNKHDLAEERGVPRREVANLVKKQWKCGYIECSAKFNWHIMLLFKELMKTVDYIDYGHKPTSLRVQDALRRNRCIIL